MSSAETPHQTGRLLLAATPIGNDADASFRLRTALTEADLVAAEDTRRAGLLLQRLGLKMKPGAKLVSCYEHNENARIPALLEAIKTGQEVVLISDAGMPSVSDPGFALTQAVIEAGLPLTVIPGPSAVLTALAISGLPTDRFTFEGFLPRKKSLRDKRLAELRLDPRTMIFFESPRRLAESLKDLSAVFGENRLAAVCRELTKTYEEVWRGTLKELIAPAAQAKGEIVVVVAGADQSDLQLSEAQALALVEQKVAAGQRLKTVVKEIAAQAQVSAKELYQAYLDQR